MNKLFAAGSYLKYRINAKGKNEVHSPFAFDLLTNVILDETPYYDFDLIESMRAKLLLDRTKIHVDDFGTGRKYRLETIASIARHALMPKKYAQLLFRLVSRFRVQTILELGTSLGITTLYLSFPGKKNRIFTLEGCSGIAAIAQKNFDRLNRENIELIVGEFDVALPKALSKTDRLDLVIFDGNHRGLATVSYFEKCLPYAHDESIFVFDDIHWSSDMQEAWKKIAANPAVSLSIDLYQLGIIFFRSGMTKQDLSLKF